MQPDYLPAFRFCGLTCLETLTANPAGLITSCQLKNTTPGTLCPTWPSWKALERRREREKHACKARGALPSCTFPFPFPFL